MTKFQVLENHQAVRELQATGNELIGVAPEFLDMSLQGVRQGQRETVEAYLIRYCNSTGNVLSLERSGNGIVKQADSATESA